MFLLDPEEYLPPESMNICTAALDATDLMSASGEIDYYCTYIDGIPVHQITYLYLQNYLENYITTTGWVPPVCQSPQGAYAWSPSSPAASISATSTTSGSTYSTTTLSEISNLNFAQVCKLDLPEYEEDEIYSSEAESDRPGSPAYVSWEDRYALGRDEFEH
jgi:hypothetical protein